MYRPAPGTPGTSAGRHWSPRGWGAAPPCSARPGKIVLRGCGCDGECRSSPSLEAATTACSRKAAAVHAAARPVSHPPSALPHPAEPCGATASARSPMGATAAAPAVPGCPDPRAASSGPRRPPPRGDRDLSPARPRVKGKRWLSSACSACTPRGTRSRPQEATAGTGAARPRGSAERSCLCERAQPRQTLLGGSVGLGAVCPGAQPGRKRVPAPAPGLRRGHHARAAEAAGHWGCSM